LQPPKILICKISYIFLPDLLHLPTCRTGSKDAQACNTPKFSFAKSPTSFCLICYTFPPVEQDQRMHKLATPQNSHVQNLLHLLPDLLHLPICRTGSKDAQACNPPKFSFAKSPTSFCLICYTFPPVEQDQRMHKLATPQNPHLQNLLHLSAWSVTPSHL